jgi:hypothetical protein
MAGIVTPDLAGFFAATRQHRAAFGSPCVFHVPVVAAWPGGTKINPDTGRPYDATAVRTNAGFTDITKTVNIILKQGSPLRPQADAQFEEAGMLSGMDIILDLDAADYAAVQGAVEFTIVTLNYKLEEFKPFELGGTMYRYLVYGMEK